MLVSIKVLDGRVSVIGDPLKYFIGHVGVEP